MGMFSHPPAGFVSSADLLMVHSAHYGSLMKWLNSVGPSIDSLVTGLQPDPVPLITTLRAEQLSLFSLLGLKKPVQEVNILVWWGEDQEPFHGAQTKSPGAAEVFQHGAVPWGTDKGVL